MEEIKKAVDPLDIYSAALELTLPDLMVEAALQIKDNNLVVANNSFPIKGKINVLAFGKASILMYHAAKTICKAANAFGADLLITHQNEVNLKLGSSVEEVIFSTHPLISEASVNAGVKAKQFVEAHDGDDILLCLVSGGGSAMVALPVEDLDLKEKIEFISEVMHKGVPEREVNELKKALSDVKGGKLAEASRDGRLINLILSDERNHQLAAISSGMTVCNELIDPVRVMDKYQLWQVPSAQVKKKLVDFGKKRNVACSKDINNFLVGSRDDLISSIKSIARATKFESVTVLENLHSCSPESAVEFLIENYLKIFSTGSLGHHLVVSTGEVQVKVDKNNPGKGGRNQHLAALMLLKSQFRFPFVFVTVATDGMDYIQGVHGARIDNSVSEEISSCRDFLVKCLEKNQSFEFHKKMGLLIEGAKTGTNMSDFFLFSFFKDA